MLKGCPSGSGSRSVDGPKNLSTDRPRMLDHSDHLVDRAYWMVAYLTLRWGWKRGSYVRSAILAVFQDHCPWSAEPSEWRKERTVALDGVEGGLNDGKPFDIQHGRKETWLPDCD